MNKPLGKSITDALKNLPFYVLGYVVGLVVALAEDINITTFALTGVAVGLATHEVLIGVAAFWVIYSVARVVFTLGQAVALRR